MTSAGLLIESLTPCGTLWHPTYLHNLDLIH